MVNLFVLGLVIYQVEHIHRSARLTEALDYDTVAPAHGIVGTREHIAEIRHYVEELRDQVAAAFASGRTLDEMKQSIDMAPYSDWASYERLRESNVEGMYRMLAD